MYFRPIIAFLFISFTIGCNKKAAPVINERTTEPVYPKATAIVLKGDAISGQVIFSAKCNRCHGLPELNQYSQKRWDNILERMLPKVRLSEQGAADVRAYVKANTNQ